MQNIINEQKLNPNLYEIIKRYPFNGKSKYLIDKFYIIGYDFPTLHYLLIENNVKDYIKEEENFVVSEFNDLLGSEIINKNNEKKSFFLPNDPPSILSEISSDYKKILPSFDNIKDIIFPNGCQFYYTNEDVVDDNSSKNLIDKSAAPRDSISIFDMVDAPKNKTKIPNSYNMVFSYNQQGEQNSKKSTNGFAFVFYKKFKEGKISKDNKKYFFFVPFTFCILSEYPFYNSYYNLCKQLQNLFKNQNNDIPIEMILYNIVNYTPSPLNSDVYINLEPFNNNGNVLNELENIKEEDENENENEKEEILFDKNNKQKYGVNMKNFHSSQRLKSIVSSNQDFKRKKTENTILTSNSKKGRNFSDLDTASVSSSKSNKKKIKQFKPIKFGLLSGYPIIQYNLAKVLLNKMSPEDVITIFFYTFLEKSVIFFSKDIELLSLTINSYLNLNFPLNDEKYYFYNVSISFENYIQGNSLFIGTTFTNAIGINSKYNNNYKNNHVRLSEHLTVDLDKGVINRVENDRENEIDEKDELLFNFFEQIYNKKELNENKKISILYREVKNIFEKLCSYKEIINKKNQEIKDKPKKKNNFNYIEYDDNEEKNKENLIRDINRDIQESFYILVNHLCIYFYQNLNLVLPDDNPNKKNPKDKELSKVVFNDNYNDNNYLQEEIFFLDELRDTMKFQSFVYEFIQNYSPIDLYKIPLTFTEEFLSMLISKSSIYYLNKKKIGFLKLIDNVYENNKKERIFMDFKQFINEYYQNYKNYFIRELKDEKEKINSFGPELNHNLIFKYKHFIDNLDKNKNCFFNYQNIINDNKIQNLQKNAIEDSIESYLMDSKILTSDDICFSNIIILYIITMKNIVMKYDCSICLSSLFYHCKVFRKYYSMIIEIIYKLMKICLQNQNYKMAENYLKTYYPFINSLRQNRLIPNENLINIIKKFYELSIDDFRKEDSNLNKSKISEDKNTSKGPENNVIDFNEKFIYIFNNFNKTSVFKEKQILEIMNSNSNYNYHFKEQLKINPKIKFHNGKEKIVFNLHSQKDLFLSLNNVYIIYITRNLDDKFLNPLHILECCLNIMIYFRNIDYFEGKDEIKTMLIQIYDLFLNMKNNNKDIIY